MSVDFENLQLQSEADVEHKAIYPLLRQETHLAIPTDRIFAKQYLAPAILDKSAGKTGGYYPDFTVWVSGFPVLVIEAKAPDVAAETGYREASLYARHLNQSYPTDLNPARFLIATNGIQLLAGYWDSEPIFDARFTDLCAGKRELHDLQQLVSFEKLAEHARICLQNGRAKQATRPFNLAGGQPILSAKKPLNTFAADLSPILRRYFSSANEGNIREIAERAYVSSTEITEYDRVLEALLKERHAVRRDTVVQPLRPNRHEERHVTRAISDFRETRPPQGQLQIIQGAVGVGKSLFMRRYRELLQSEELAEITRWAFIDFNSGPANLLTAEKWVCSAFIESFQRENPEIDLGDSAVLRGLFSRNIQKRRGIYEDISRNSPEQAAVLKANDLAKWQDDPEELTRGLADYVLGSRNEILVVVLDNVDRLDLQNQLHAFQLALWFMEKTHCFIILQMRDETYERFKNKPPLDTFRSGITFHISPPRFIDVVKRRLDLGSGPIKVLAARSNH